MNSDCPVSMFNVFRGFHDACINRYRRANRLHYSNRDEDIFRLYQKDIRRIGRLTSDNCSFMFYTGEFPQSKTINSDATAGSGIQFLDDTYPYWKDPIWFVPDVAYSFSVENPNIIIDINAFCDYIKHKLFFDFYPKLKSKFPEHNNDYYIKLLMGIVPTGKVAWFVPEKPKSDPTSNDVPKLRPKNILLSTNTWFSNQIYDILKGIDRNFKRIHAGNEVFTTGIYYIDQLDNFLRQNPNQFSFKLPVLWRGYVLNAIFYLKISNFSKNNSDLYQIL